MARTSKASRTKAFWMRMLLLGWVASASLVGCSGTEESNDLVDGDLSGDLSVLFDDETALADAGDRFDQFDTNGDGSLTLDEVENRRIFSQLDANADGQITRQEARAYLQQRRQGGETSTNTANTARNQFEQFDRNGDGSITADELNNQRLFSRLDANADGQITPREARAYLEQRGQGGGNPSAAQPDAAPETSTNTARSVSGEPSFDVAYSSPAGSDPSRTSLDIYPIPNSPSAPVVIYVHGGGWKNGDKSNVSGKPEYFNRNGYLFVSLNYRLIPDVRYPENVQDVADGVAWVYNNIEQYGGDPEKMFLLGHSAGAHLAGLVATDADYLTNAGESLGVLDGVVLLDSGAYDIPLNISRSGPNSEALYVEAFGNNPSVWADASPINQVAPGNQTPPFLLVHADRRDNKAEQAYEFSDALEAVGAKVEIVEAPDETHQTLNRTLGEPSNVATDAIIDFFSGL